MKAKEGCQGGREVVLYDGDGYKRGSDTSNARGNYKIKFNDPADRQRHSHHYAWKAALS